MRIAGIINNSVVNGIGIRDVIFFQGCEHRCRNCHNPDTWDMNGGVEQTIPEIISQLNLRNNITISGGDPLYQFEALVALIYVLKTTYRKNIWIYTGFRYEDIDESKLAILTEFADVLVDGAFEESKKDLRLPFRGSSNQRIIDLKRSKAANKIILVEDTV